MVRRGNIRFVLNRLRGISGGEGVLAYLSLLFLGTYGRNRTGFRFAVGWGSARTGDLAVRFLRRKTSLRQRSGSMEYRDPRRRKRMLASLTYSGISQRSRGHLSFRPKYSTLSTRSQGWICARAPSFSCCRRPVLS